MMETDKRQKDVLTVLTSNEEAAPDGLGVLLRPWLPGSKKNEGKWHIDRK